MDVVRGVVTGSAVVVALVLGQVVWTGAGAEAGSRPGLLVVADRGGGSGVGAAAPGPTAARPAGRVVVSGSQSLVSHVVSAATVRATASASAGGPSAWRALATDPRVHLTMTTSYYDVRGSTPEAINASMNRAGPKAIGSKNAIGEFRSKDSISYFLIDRGSSCSLSNFTVTHQATVTLPRWRGSEAATDATRAWWAATLRDIVQHEQEHAFIAQVQIRAMPDELARLGTASSCAAMKADVKRVSNRRWAAEGKLNDDFDTWTDHGTTGPYWLG